MNLRCKIFVLSIIMILLMSSISYAVDETGSSIGKAMLRLVFYTLILIFVLVVAIYGTRFIAKNSRRFVNSKYMKVIDNLNLGTNIKIIMLEINKTIYVFAITNNSVEVIDKFSEEEFEKSLDFDEELNKYMDGYAYQKNYSEKIQGKINKILNKFIDKEEENNEKKC